MPNRIAYDEVPWGSSIIQVSTIEPDGGIVRFHETALRLKTVMGTSPWVLMESYGDSGQADQGHSETVRVAEKFPKALLICANRRTGSRHSY